MERRYLVVALAIIATFAVTSRGFRALEHMSAVHARHDGAMAKSQCELSTAARAIAKIRTRLRPRYPEEAQLLAEMSVPVTALDTMAGQMARQNAAIAQCARERAMRDAEHAYHDALRLQRQQMTHFTDNAGMPPAAISALPPDFEQQIQRSVAMATRMAANNVKLQIAADKLRGASVQMEGLDIPAIDVSDDGGRVTTHVHTHFRCNVDRTRAGQQQPE